jgi:hypothetical protein
MVDHLEQPSRPHLEPAPAPPVLFCGYCGEGAPDERGEISRVCARCSLGLLLRAPGELRPERADAFLVVDDLLRIRALSRRAERVLAVSETAAVDRQLHELLVAADVSAADSDALRAAVIDGLYGRSDGGRPMRIAVRPPGHHGVRFAARVGPCQPGPAALIVLGALD